LGFKVQTEPGLVPVHILILISVSQLLGGSTPKKCVWKQK